MHASCAAGEGYAAQQPLLSTKTIHLFYKPLTEQLVLLLRGLDLPSDKAAVKDLDGVEIEAKVASVAQVIGLFSGLLSPSKCLDKHNSFIAHIMRMRLARPATTLVSLLAPSATSARTAGRPP